MFTLLIMFFITPPNDINPADKDTKQDQRVWTLQSTSVMEFATLDQCKRVQQEISHKMDTTNTLKIRAWCFGKGAAGPSVKSGEPPDANIILPMK